MGLGDLAKKIRNRKSTNRNSSPATFQLDHFAANRRAAQGDLLLFDGSSWSANAALGPDGAGVIRIQVAAPLVVDESDPAQPLLSVEPASTTAAGVLRLAAAEDLIAGTEGAAVDAAALKEAMATAQPAGDYMPLDLSTLPALP